MTDDRVDAAIEDLSSIVLFADLSRPELREVDRILEEEFFDAGRRILRRDIDGPNFYVIVEGEAAVRDGDQELARLANGDFFGEVPLLLGETPQEDVAAVTDLRCRVLSGSNFEAFMLEHPSILYRLLQQQTFRMRSGGEAPSR